MLIVYAVAGSAIAAEPSVLGSELMERGKKLSVAEVKQIIVNDVEVEQVNGNTGSVRHWKNNPDGKFIASRMTPGRQKSNVTGQGEWKLTDNGQYCVQLEFRSRSGTPELDSWCRTLWVLDDAMYLAPIELTTTREKKYGQVKFSK